MSEKDSPEGAQPKQPQNPPLDQTVTDLALQQVQMGLNVFWLIQQAALQQQQQQQQPVAEGTSSSSTLSTQQHSSLYSALSTVFGEASSSPVRPTLSPQQPQQNSNGIPTKEDKRRRDLSIIGKRWEYVSDVQSFAEFEQLRCRHQVSRNRTFAHGIRYSCTQKTQLRSNCPYLLLCLFSDGAGEHSASGVGTISVYSRNKHTHPVKVIKARQPRRFAKLAKKGRKELETDEEAHSDKMPQEATEEAETVEKGQKIGNGTEREEEKAINGRKSGGALVEMLSRMLAAQQKQNGGGNA
uniref:FLYWCH-type domain-containing protein n=1 Tax=Globodera pallida TaxID=36090 RepID=A0A183BM67_GLOPA